MFCQQKEIAQVEAAIANNGPTQSNSSPTQQPLQTEQLNYINFNQEATCLSIGTSNGFKLYNCDPFGLCYVHNQAPSTICEMLFNTSLVVSVGAGQQQQHPSLQSPPSSVRRLQLFNIKRQTKVCELDFSTAILRAHINRKFLVVVLRSKIHVYDLATMKQKWVHETGDNPNGVSALSHSGTSPIILCFPSAGGKEGSIDAYDLDCFECIANIQAHKTTISHLALSPTGHLLATASDKGTIIRIFSVLKGGGERIVQFRRGTMAAKIYAIRFDESGHYVCVTSNSETVHIFKIDCEGGNNEEFFADGNIINGGGNTQQPFNNFERSTSSTQDIGVKERLTGKRHFAHVQLPTHSTKSIATLIQETRQVRIVMGNGEFLVYSIDLERGGKCHLISRSMIEKKTQQKFVEGNNRDRADSASTIQSTDSAFSL